MFDEEIEIASRTDSKYEGRQFNKLLRAVIFVIGKFIKTYNNTPIRIISSVAENPISAYLMIDTFDSAPFSEDYKLLRTLMKPKEGFLTKEEKEEFFKNIEKYMDKPEGETEYRNKINTSFNTSQDIKTAEKVFHNILNTKLIADIEKRCITNVGGNKTKRMKKPKKLKKSRKSRKSRKNRK